MVDGRTEEIPTGESTPRELWADIGALKVRYLDWGGDGPPLLALHGLASSANWYDIVARLLRDRYHIYAPDQRGHGQTTSAPDGYDWKTLSDDLAGMLDHIGLDQVAVMGHSWGGNVATNFAADYPGRVSRLIMIEGGFLDGRLFPGATWESFSHRVRPRDVTGNREEFLDRLRNQLGAIWNGEVERIVQTMVYEDEDGQIQDILRPENHAQVIRAMWDEPASVTMPRIECPTLMIAAGPTPERAGSEFAETRRRMVDAAEKNLKNGRVHWIPETIHDIGYHKPQELAQVIDDFLSEK
ncbi:MAG: alpha/beta hydrolase [Chloroflexi bacterium]|nr:alpha/beta hydrolase [Chloroflexota bacterium]MCI0810094.1 alpha/beta hydrolase [Chloroflexota bacterium]MCI0847083.1 alpha/beta hydrolase [Chloroflexota bacterium]MCI0864447.1 alpha/beta hydrolase [Chloroflexota bacterium]MCI0897956.1 alpha/beta hydrolase [Chloroflexota bacterium]